MHRVYEIAWWRQRDKGTGSPPIFRDSGGHMTIMIRGWRILEYRGTRGYNWLCPIWKTVVKDVRLASDLKKWRNFSENRAVEAKREAE